MVTCKSPRSSSLQRFPGNMTCASPDPNNALHSASAYPSMVCNLMILEGQRKVCNKFLLLRWDVSIVVGHGGCEMKPMNIEHSECVQVGSPRSRWNVSCLFLEVFVIQHSTTFFLRMSPVSGSAVNHANWIKTE